MALFFSGGIVYFLLLCVFGCLAPKGRCRVSLNPEAHRVIRNMPTESRRCDLSVDNKNTWVEDDLE